MGSMPKPQNANKQLLTFSDIPVMDAFHEIHKSESRHVFGPTTHVVGFPAQWLRFVSTPLLEHHVQRVVA